MQCFAESALNCPPEVAVNLSFYEDFQETPADVELLLKAKILRYSFNTWKSHSSVNKKYFEMCDSRDIASYPVNVGVLNFSLLSLAQAGKSIGIVESLIKAVSFFSEFLGCGPVATHYNVTQMGNFLNKVCPKVTNKQERMVQNP